MPRTLPSALLTDFQSGFGSFVLLVLITRADGQKFGFTSSDQAISYSGVTYEPTDGGSMSALRQTVGTGIDNSDFLGALTSTRITEADIYAGLFDGARIVVSLVNAANVAHGVVVIASGFIGQFDTVSGGFKAEFRGLGQLLRQVAGDTTCYQCRVRRLGDSQCKVNLSGNTVTGYPIHLTATVSSVTDSLDFVFGPGVSTPSGLYNGGLIIWSSGANLGTISEVKIHTYSAGYAAMILRQPTPFLPTIGDAATLEIACDRMPSTCLNEFNNLINYRGEKDLPGNLQISITGRPPS